MWNQISKWLWLKDDTKTSSDRLARTLFHFLVSLFSLNLLLIVILISIKPDVINQLNPAWIFFIITFISSIFLRKRTPKLGGIILVGSLWILQIITIYPGEVSAPGFHSLFFIFLLAGMIFGIKVMLSLLLFTIILIFSMVMGQIYGLIPSPAGTLGNQLYATFIQCSILCINTILTALALRILNQERNQANFELAERIKTFQDLENSRHKLSKNERMLEGLTNNLPGVVFQLFIDENYMYKLNYVGKKSTEIFGISPDSDNIIDNFIEHLHPEDKPVFLDSIRSAVNQRKDWVFECRFIKDDQNLIWIRGISSPDMEDKPVFNGIILDITAQKKLQQAIDFKQEQISAFTDNPSVAIMIADSSGKIVHANDPYARLLETEVENTLGKYIWDLTVDLLGPQIQSEKLRNQIKSTFFHAVEAGKLDPTRKNVFEAITRSGKKLILQQNMFIFQTSQGPCMGTFLIDQTELESTRTAQQDSEKSFRAIFEQGPYETSVSRMTGELIDVNERFCLETGLPREKIIGKTARLLGRLNEEDENRLRELAQKTGGIIDRYEMSMFVNGHERNVLLSAKVMELHDQPEVFTIITDITDLKKSQKNVQQQLDQITGLRKIDTSIISGSEISDTLNLILDQAVHSLNAKTARLLLGLDASRSPVRIYSRGENLEDITLLEKEDFLIKKMEQDRETVLVSENEIEESHEALNTFYNENKIRYHCLVPAITGGKLIGIIEIFFEKDPHIDVENWQLYIETLSGQITLAIKNFELISGLQEKNEELLEAYESTISGWAHALEIRDEETFGHSERVLELSLRVAKALNFSEIEISNFRRGVLLHDIGKIGIPDSILLKPGPLDESEWKIMKQHPVFAYNLLKGISFLKNSLDVPHSHHERWDGSGYPDGLRGEEIPIAARVFAVIDVWDALINDRPYRKAWSKEKTRNYLIENSNVQFDPTIVDIFLKIISSEMENGE